MIKELTEYYEPEKVLHRDSQMEEIKRVFKNFKEQSMASNLLIQGHTGSGKTTIVKKIMDEENQHVFASGAATKTSFRMLKSMFDINCSTNERLLRDVMGELRRNPKIIIIDEIDKVSDSKILFNDLNTIYRESGCPIIIITNKITIREDMPQDARLTLMFEKVDFPPYNSLELYDILKSRLDLVKDRLPKIPESSLRRICAVGKNEASARVVLQLTLKCILANNFTEEYINQIKKSLLVDDLKDFYLNLKPTEKDFLKNILELKAKGEIIKPSRISKRMDDFTPSRISQLISSFENYGIIESKWKNTGRAGGRTRIIEFAKDKTYRMLDEIVP